MTSITITYGDSEAPTELTMEWDGEFDLSAYHITKALELVPGTQPILDIEVTTE